MTDTTDELLIGNACLVLADRVIENGWLAASRGLIVDFGAGRAPKGALDFGGDTLVPGLVELHTDHLETHFLPRPGVVWHAEAAVHAYDAQMAASGVTTVFDSLRVGQDDRKDVFSDYAGDLIATIAAAAEAGTLRAEHRTHLRCEVCSDDVIAGTEKLIATGQISLLSLMDHTPGQRQFRNVERLKEYYRGKHGMSEAQIERFMADRHELHARNAGPHRRALVALAKAHGVAMASHDDATIEQVAEAVDDGIAIAEFPTTVEAAAASHKAGIKVLMGAPNVVRGGSHSGNVAAVDLAHAGTLDILSSDYVPGSLLLAVERLTHDVDPIDLPHAMALVTRNPARSVGLHDRGEIAPGLRADLVRLQLGGTTPVVRAVWRLGQRVM
jgi:alpha-D-ribose 1-methylphosphonate 5-triphosphate diphosphatase